MGPHWDHNARQSGNRHWAMGRNLGEASKVDHDIAHHTPALDRFVGFGNVLQGEPGANAVLQLLS